MKTLDHWTCELANIEYCATALRNTWKMAASDSKAPIRSVKRVQFGILSADECVSILKIWNVF